MKSRYFIILSFRGTAYHGWQIQPHSITVQEALDNALSTILNEEIKTTGAGRTDTGVHAKFFCAHLDSIKSDLIQRSKLINRLNRYLPKDISIKQIARVADTAHARFSAVSRTYRYYISRVKDPFRDDLLWYYNGNMELETMNKACKILMKHDDFTSFSRLHSDNKTNLCKIYHAEWTERENIVIFTIKADRFLRNMVRAITGTMIDIGRGRTSLNRFEEIIKSKNRGNAGKSAPASGLFLEDIGYPPEIFI